MSEAGAASHPGLRPLCLLVGSPRSGTTLAFRLVRELRGTGGPGLETAFFLIVGERLARCSGGPSYTRPQVVAALDAYKAHWRLYDASLDTDAVLARVDGSDRIHVVDLFQAVLEELSQPAAVRVLCEKTPRHLWSWPVLEPERQIKVIAVARDPRAVVPATMRRKWSEDQCLAAAEWGEEQHEIDRLARHLGSDRVLLVRYEDIVHDPSSFQASVASFLGLPDTEPRAVSEKEIFPAAELGWKAAAVGPVDERLADRWRDELDPDAVAMIESFVGPRMRALGYELVGPDRRRRSVREQRRLLRARLNASLLRRDALRLAGRYRGIRRLEIEPFVVGAAAYDRVRQGVDRLR